MNGEHYNSEDEDDLNLNSVSNDYIYDRMSYTVQNDMYYEESFDEKVIQV